MLHAITSYLLQKETITGTEMKAILEGRDPELAEAEVSGVSRAMRGPAASPPSPTAWRPPPEISTSSATPRGPPVPGGGAGRAQSARRKQDPGVMKEVPRQRRGTSLLSHSLLQI